MVAARLLQPEGAFGFNDALQGSFYRDNLDPTEPATFLEVAGAVGLDEGEFQRSFESEATALATRADFELSRRMGVMGFPTLLVRDEVGLHTVTRGWLPPDRLWSVMTSWL